MLLRCLVVSLTFAQKRPLPDKYPIEPKTIGEHIRKRRMDLKMTQKELSKQFGVSEDTITYWEVGRSKPQKKFYSRIISFLKYTPVV
jgi:DNA-binding transcriptional regulator YiaG